MKDDISQKSTWKYDIFFKCFEIMVFPKTSHWNMIFLLSSGKFFSTNGEMKDDLSQKNTWKYDLFCMFGKDGISFPRNMKLPFCQKDKDDLFPKNIHLNMTFPALLKKMIFVLENMILAF